MYARGGNRNRGSFYKLAILGDGGVGKTALTIQLCLSQFVETYDPTIEDSYRKKLLLDGAPVTLEILDTAGQEEYTALRDQWIREGEGFVLVYSITSRDTFNRINQYFEQIARVKEGEDYAAVLVANKCDRNDERVVSVNEGKELAKKLGVTFFETSAKLNINTEQAFISCARETREIRESEEQPEQVSTEPTTTNKVNTNESTASNGKESHHVAPKPAVSTAAASEAPKQKKKKCLIM